MRTPLNKGKREPQTGVGAFISKQTLVKEKKKKKKAAECRFWQKYPRPQMHLPARPRCSLCLSPSGLFHSVLALILPADSREATGYREEIAIREGAGG